MRKFVICRGYENKATLPKRGTKYSAGYDICTANPIPIEIGAGETVTIPTGIKAYMGEDEVLLIHVRSSVGIKLGLVLANIVAVIDSDYVNSPNEGNIILAIRNTTDKPVVIQPKERLAQGIFIKNVRKTSSFSYGDISTLSR